MLRLTTLLLLAVPLLAETPRRALLPLDFRPAIYTQDAPDVATDGTEFIAVWADERAKDRPNLTRGYDVFATRLTADGLALEPYGVEIASMGYSPQIEWNGRTYLVTYNIGTQGWARRVGRNARPSDPARRISDLPVLDLATDGSTFCALTFNYPDSAIVLLDENANVLRRIPIAGLEGSVVSAGRNYLAFTIGGTSLLATTLAPDGSLTQRPIATVAEGTTLVSARSNGSRVLVAWTNGATTEMAVFDDRAAMVGSSLRFGNLEPGPHALGRPSVAWDGGTFLVTWPESSGAMAAVRVSAAGRTVGAGPFVILTRSTQFQSATNGFRTVLVSTEEVSEAPDAVSRVVTSFGTELPDPHVIAFTGTPYSEPQVAAMGKVALAVAREGESYGGIAASLFTIEQPGESRLLLAPQEWNVTRDGPSVAAGDDAFLVAWREVTDFRTRILAKRVRPDGTSLDSEPIVVDDDGRAIEHYGETAVAWNGQSFLVVWHSSEDAIEARVVDRNGQPGARSTLSTANGNVQRRTPAVVWSGNSYLVVWSETQPLVGGVSPQNPQHTEYRAAHMSGDGNVLGDAETLFETVGFSQGLALAASRTHILLATTTGSYLSGADWPVHTFLLDRAGNALSAAPARVDTATPTFRRMHPAAAWTGTSFAVFWNERPWLEDWSVIEGRSISSNGAMETLALDRSPAFFPAATSFEGGALLVETAALVEQANMARLYARTFAPVRAKTRAARK